MMSLAKFILLITVATFVSPTNGKTMDAINSFGKSIQSSFVLKTGFRFVEGQFLRPEEILSNPRQGVSSDPHFTLPPAQPFGTIYVRINRLESSVPLGVQLRVDSAFRLLWFDIGSKRLISEENFGQPSEDRHNERVRLGQALFRLPLSQGVSDYLLVVHLSNFSYKPGGIWLGPKLGSFDDLRLQQNAESHSQIAVVAMIMIMGVYNLFLFLRRKEDLAAAFLAGYCLTMGLRNCAMSFFFLDLLGDLSSVQYEIVRKIEFLPLMAAFSCFLTFIYVNFKSFIKVEVVKFTWLFALIYTAASLILPARYFTRLLGPTNIYMTLSSVYASYCIARAGFHNVLGARLLGLSMVAMVATAIADVLIASGALEIPFISGYGLILLILAQGQVLAKQFAKAYQDTKRLNLELKEQEAARTLFFHNTSHELRTPLNGIIGFTSLLFEGAYGNLSDKVKEQVGKIGTLANSLIVQVNTILDIAKSRRGELELNSSIISLNELVNEARSLGEGLAHKYTNSAFVLETNWVSSRTVSFITDQQKMFVVIRNLIGNAFKFVKSGSHNTVKVEFNIDEHQHVLVIKVSDQGIGIPKDKQDLIFNEFSQIDQDERRSFEGTGLGLAMVKEIIELMNGKIEVSSEPGKGSCFTISIPENKKVVLKSLTKGIESGDPTRYFAYDGNTDNALEGVEEIGSLEGFVFIIDDNETNCEVQGAILKNSGFEVDFSLSGMDGLNAMRRRRPDLLILDMMMPEMSGEDVLRELRSDPNLSSIPVILLTARASQEDRIKGLNMGADDYLPKPVSGNELILRVHNLIDRQNQTRNSQEQQVAQGAFGIYSLDKHNVPNIEGFDIACEFNRGTKLASDWIGFQYDKISDRLYIIIGDVSGGGISSTYFAVAASSACRAAINLSSETCHLSMEEQIVAVAKSVNRSLLDIGSQVEKIMTMAMVCIDTKTGSACYLNAGHPTVYIRNAQGIVKGFLKPSDPLGLNSTPKFGLEKFHLGVGSSLFMYTDGLINNQNNEGKTIQFRDIKKVLSENIGVHGIKQSLLEKVSHTWGSEMQSDDSAFVLIKRLDPILKRTAS